MMQRGLKQIKQGAALVGLVYLACTLSGCCSARYTSTLTHRPVVPEAHVTGPYRIGEVQLGGKYQPGDYDAYLETMLMAGTQQKATERYKASMKKEIEKNPRTRKNIDNQMEKHNAALAKQEALVRNKVQTFLKKKYPQTFTDSSHGMPLVVMYEGGYVGSTENPFFNILGLITLQIFPSTREHQYSYRVWLQRPGEVQAKDRSADIAFTSETAVMVSLTPFGLLPNPGESHWPKKSSIWRGWDARRLEIEYESLGLAVLQAMNRMTPEELDILVGKVSAPDGKATQGAKPVSARSDDSGGVELGGAELDSFLLGTLN